jgi:intracellular multiplication protein IcmT
MANIRSFKESQWWRSALQPKLNIIIAKVNGWVMLFFFLLLLHPRMYTLYFVLGIVVFFAILEKFGMTMPVFFRRFRKNLAGNHRYIGNIKNRRRRFVNGG